jgi:hypothetical protein
MPLKTFLIPLAAASRTAKAGGPDNGSAETQK